MDNFFHGWRRKTGLVTLIVSLSLMGGWIRSLVYCDLFSFHHDQNHDHLIFSNNEVMGWGNVEHEEGHLGDFYQHNDVQNDVWTEINIESRWNWCGFDFIQGKTKSTDLSVVVWNIPYWAITPAVVLLAAYLLFKTPPTNRLITAQRSE